jgi:hypothetical protein
MSQATQVTKWNYTEQARQSPGRSVGLGRPLPNVVRGNMSPVEAKRAQMIGAIKMGWKQCPTYNLPVIDSVCLHYGGPLTSLAVQQTFGPTINPLGANQQSPPPLCEAVETTFAEPGKFQTFAFVCAIQWMLDVEPEIGVFRVNSVIAPTSPVNKPVSPDFFAAVPTDIATSGALGLSATQSPSGNFLPGYLNWGVWQELVAYYMARAYSLFWQVGHSQYLTNDPLRYTAFVPSNAQDGSASNSESELLWMIRRTNAYYRTALATSRIALMIDRVRVGNKTLAGTPGLSVFHPSRAYETGGVTYGGMGLLSKLLKGNQEFRRLTAPVMFWPGQPIGLKAQVSAGDDQILMQQWLDASFSGGPTGLGAGLVPASFTEDANISAGPTIAGSANLTGVEPSLDAVEADNGIQPFAQRDYYKGGSWKLRVAFKGFELTPDQAEMWTNDKLLQDAVKQECGCSMAFPGA